MRYVQIDTISFTDINGNQYAIKDIRPIPTYTTLTEVSIKEGDTIDEIATRDKVYRAGSEDLSYKIYDHNIVALVDSRFDLGKIKTLRIPA